MQRSMVKQFKTSNSSLFQSTILGTHSMLAHRSPSKDTDAIYLHKSRIAHLPSDKCQDLSSRLNFVVVFQSIEITRLTEEISFLRGRLKEYEGRAFNTGSYEVQIRELIQKCNKLQNQKYSYCQQLSQTKEVSQNIFNQLSLLKNRYGEVDFCVAEKYKLEKTRNEELGVQIEKWKSRYNSLDRNRGEELQSYKKMLQTQKESLLNREGKELVNRMEIEREQLANKLRQRKEQLDERQLQMKKLMNGYEQSQIRLREQQELVKQYEEKVAMLSQQNYRLSQLLRVKQEEIKGLKMANEHQFSIRMSQVTSLDETRHVLNGKLRTLQEQNQDLRDAVKSFEDTVIVQKKKLTEMERVQFQLKEAHDEIDNKFKAIERKDKKIMMLQDEIKRNKKIEQELGKFKQKSIDLSNKIIALRQEIDEKVEQLQQIKKIHKKSMQDNRQYQQKLNKKISQFSKMYQTLQKSYINMRSASQQNLQRSATYQLKLKEISLQIKQKDYRIISLQNQLKQYEGKLTIKDSQIKTVISELEDQLSMERQISEAKFKDIKIKSDRKNQQISDLKKLISSLTLFQRDMQQKYSASAQEMKSVQQRLTTIQKIIFTIKTALQKRYASAQETQQRIKHIEIKYQQLYEWFIGMMKRVDRFYDESPRKDLNKSSFSPTRRDSQNTSITGSNTNLFAVTEPTLVNGNASYAQSHSIYSYQTLSPKSKQREVPAFQNVNRINNDTPIEISANFLLSHVLMCAQIQSLRKRVGDKNAKMQTMRNSIATKSINKQQGSSGFFTSRDSSLGRKQNIYY